jgi:hypothetical protein
VPGCGWVLEVRGRESDGGGGRVVTLFRMPIGMAFFNFQVLLKSSEITEFRYNQQSGFTEKF